MAYDDFQAIVRAAAREVSLRSQAAYWLLAEKNKDLVSILAEMRATKRERWIQEQVLKSYEEARWYVGYIEPRIQYAEDQLKKSLETGDMRRVNQYRDDLIELGESYLYWSMLLRSCRDIFDAVWKLGTVLPVPDFDEHPDETVGPGTFLTILKSRGGALHRSSRAAVSRMEAVRKREIEETEPVSEEMPVPKMRDSRVRPLDEVIEAERKKREMEEFDDSSLVVRGLTDEDEELFEEEED